MKLINMRRKEDLACAIEGVNMTREKEVELQKIADHMQPLVQTFESNLIEEINIEKQKQGLPTDAQSPEEEAEIQAKLDAELAAFQKAQQEKNKVQLESMVKTEKEKLVEKVEKETAADEKVEPKVEVVEEKPKKRGRKPNLNN